MKIVKTIRFIGDFELLVTYLKSVDNLKYATKLFNKIEKAIHNIKVYPEMYAKIPEKTTKNIRQIAIDKYRIIYEIKNDTIYIKTIIGKNLFSDTL